MSPKVAGIDVPPLRITHMSERQLEQMTPFERDALRRLDGHDEAIHGVRTAVEGLAKAIEEHQRQTADRVAAAARRAAWWAWIRTTVVTPTVIVAAIGAFGNWAVERAKRETVAKIEAQSSIRLDEKASKLEERAAVKAEDLARAILDEQERRERQRPVNRDPDRITR